MKLRNTLLPSVRQHPKILLLIAGVALLGFGSYGLVQRYRQTHKPSTAISKKIITESTDTPSEGPVQCDKYTVPAAQPRLISIPSIGVKACMQKLGINQVHNRLATPTNLHLAGWYIYSAVPGDQGVSIIDGHVTGRYGDGVFKHLDRVTAGDKISVEFGNGNKRSFEVVSVDNYSVTQAASEQYKKLPNIDRQLTVITCGGSFDKTQRKYDQRTIVRAKLDE